MIRIAILGEIGSGNLGDDLGFIVIRDELIRSFREHGFESQIDYCPPSRFSNLDHSGYEIVLTGCGTLLDECGGAYVHTLHNMQERRKITAVIGSGMSDPMHLIPNEEGKKLLERVLSRVVGGWVRGKDGPDPIWLKGWIAEKNEDRELIGFNMGYAAYTGINIEEVWARIRVLYFALKQEKMPVTFVSCWKNDLAWFRNYVPKEPVLDVASSSTSLKKLSLLKTLVAFRGHLGMIATAAGVTVLPVVFSSKVEDMYRNTDLKTRPLSLEKDDWEQELRKTIAEPSFNNEVEIGCLAKEVRKRISEFVKKAAGQLR